MRHQDTIPATTIQEILQQAFPQGIISVFTPDERHYTVEVTDQSFIGKGLVEQHRLVNSALAAAFQMGLHAVNIKTIQPN